MRDFAARQSDQDIHPPDPDPECTWCDGLTRIAVVSIVKADGQIVALNDYPEIPCFHCLRDPGIEPELENERRRA